MKKTIHLDPPRVEFRFDSGAMRTVYLSDVSAGVQTYAALHGIAQRAGDNAAGATTEEDRFNAVCQMADHIESAASADDWNRRATGDGSGNVGLLVRALVQMSGRPIDEIKETVGRLDKKEQAALRAQPSVAAVIETLRPPKKIDAGAADTAANLLATLVRG